MSADALAALAGLCGVGGVWVAMRRRTPPRPVRALVRDRTAPVPVVALEVRTVFTSVGGLARRVTRRPPDPVADHRVGVAVALGLLGTVLHPVVGVALGATPMGIDVLRRRRAKRRAVEELIVEVPDVVDLFRVAAGAGLTVRQAVEAVGAVIDGQLAPVFREVQRRVRLGARLADALGLVGQVGEPARPLAGALISAERDGAALAVPLERAADHARDLRRRRAEEAARRVPVQLLFPLVACVLPAFALLTVVPLLAGTLQTLSL